MKTKDLATTGAHISDAHYRKEPDNTEKGKCYYCGAIMDIEELKEHKGILVCKRCED